jgi:hypothetical protein
MWNGQKSISERRKWVRYSSWRELLRMKATGRKSSSEGHDLEQLTVSEI